MFGLESSRGFESAAWHSQRRHITDVSGGGGSA